MFRKGVIALIALGVVASVFIALTLLNTGKNDRKSVLPESTVASDKAVSPSNDRSANQQIQASSLTSQSELDCASMPQPDWAETEERWENYRISLQSQTSEQAQLATVVFNYKSPLEVRLQEVSDFLQIYPNNQLALKLMLGMCDQRARHRPCPASLIQQVSASESEDGELWLYAAEYFAAVGDSTNVFESLEKLRTATYFGSEYADYIGLVDDTVVAEQVMSIAEAIPLAVGIWSARPSRLEPLVSWCTEKPDDVVRVETCLGFGKALVSRGKTTIQTIQGAHLQSQLFALTGNDEGKARVETFMAEQSQVDSEALNTGLLFLMYDEKLYRQWLENLAVKGESAALSTLIDEAQALSESPDYSPCPSLPPADS